jgi:TetR/AcrR family transcriptional repressor of nem operon
MGRPKSFDKEQVLQKALDVFWTKGYSQTSMDDLTDAMDIQRKSLYNTFTDKKNLYRLTLNLYKSQMKDRFKQIVESDKDTKTQLKDILKLIMIQGEKGCFILNTSIELSNIDQELQSFTSSYFLDIKKLFSRVIVNGQVNGEVSLEKNPDTMASIFLNTWLACLVLVKSGYKSNEIEDIINQTVELID